MYVPGTDFIKVHSGGRLTSYATVRSLHDSVKISHHAALGLYSQTHVATETLHNSLARTATCTSACKTESDVQGYQGTEQIHETL